MTLTTCTIVDAQAIAEQLPAAVAAGQFEDGDVCVVLGFLGMEDEVVVVSPRTGLVFKLLMDDSSVCVDN